MSTLTRIKLDFVTARKAQDRVSSALLGTLIGAIETREKTFNPARPISETEIILEVKKLLDGVTEVARLIETAAGREEQRLRVARERQVLETYMPAQMDEAEITAFAQARKTAGMNFGAVMKALKAERGGQYDGAMAAGVVRRVVG